MEDFLEIERMDWFSELFCSVSSFSICKEVVFCFEDEFSELVCAGEGFLNVS